MLHREEIRYSARESYRIQQATGETFFPSGLKLRAACFPIFKIGRLDCYCDGGNPSAIRCFVIDEVRFMRVPKLSFGEESSLLRRGPAAENVLKTKQEKLKLTMHKVI